jgi:PAS domain S-box-containing protein
MDDTQKTKAQLLAELNEVRRGMAELETAVIERCQTEQRLMNEARIAEAALRTSEARGQALLESVTEGILLIGASGRITLVNAAAERMFGYDHTALLGQTIEILLPECIQATHVQHRARYFAGPRARPKGIGLDLAGRRKDGTEFPVEISYGGSSENVAMALITDITERKRVEAELGRQREALHQTEKLAALGTLAASVAHEINNPLGIISSRIELMLLDAEDQKLTPQVLEDLQVLHRATQRVARIASNLHSLARQAPREYGPVNLNGVVEETLLLMQKPLEVDGIRIITSLDHTLAPILGDVNTLQQVLLNLVTNARQAMTGGGEIRIETGPVAERPNWVRVVVADTGPGISPEELKRVFDPFYTTKRNGTGLGLSVSYSIIQDHHGTVDVQSVPGLGTTFVLAFSVASSGRPRAEPPDEGGGRVSKERRISHDESDHNPVERSRE